MPEKIIKLLESDGTWDAFEQDWKLQCQKYKEDFSDYAAGTFSVVREIIKSEEQKAGVFAFHDGDKHQAICQINVAGIPGYDSPVMRVRYLTLSPDFDFGDATVEEYATALVNMLACVLALSEADKNFKSRHIKFHLPSPSDRNFFSMFGSNLNESDKFEVVRVQGAWLYISKLKSEK